MTDQDREALPASDAAAAIRDGVFFTLPGTLPRGRHDLGRDEVLRVHRERTMIAATELLALDGYHSFGVRNICSRAGISQAAFYRCFDDRDQCIFSAYDRFIAVLSQRLLEAPSETDTDPAQLFLLVYLDMLARDPVTARAFLVEMEALGNPARTRRRDALHSLAGALKARREAWLVDAIPDDVATYLAAIYALRQMTADMLDTSAQPTFDRLANQAAGWLRRLLVDANP